MYTVLFYIFKDLAVKQVYKFKIKLSKEHIDTIPLYCVLEPLKVSEDRVEQTREKVDKDIGDDILKDLIKVSEKEATRSQPCGWLHVNNSESEAPYIAKN